MILTGPVGLVGSLIRTVSSPVSKRSQVICCSSCVFLGAIVDGFMKGFFASVSIDSAALKNKDIIWMCKDSNSKQMHTAEFVLTFN